VKIDLPTIRPIQLYNMNADGEDDLYVVVSGVAKGQPVDKRLPESGATKVSPKKPAFTPDKPGLLWEGELNDGEFAYLTVVLMQGEGKDQAKFKEFAGKLAEAAGKISERAKKTLTSDDSDKLVEGTVKAQRDVVTKVKDTFSRDKKTDHYGGLFNVLVWNNGGKITKRLDPVGLTFGEHYGTDEKIYTKLKYTRPNVLVQEGGEWSQVQLEPLSEDQKTIRVKMLETELIKKGGGEPVRNVTDYVAEVQVTAAGKPTQWEVDGEQVGPGALHTYWEWAKDPQ
jgi:hypothetical protein